MASAPDKPVSILILEPSRELKFRGCQFTDEIVEGPVFSRWFRMLIFGLWFECVLEGLNLPKNDVAIFFGDFFILFSRFQIIAQIVINDFITLPPNTSSIQSKHSI